MRARTRARLRTGAGAWSSRAAARNVDRPFIPLRIIVLECLTRYAVTVIVEYVKIIGVLSEVPLSFSLRVEEIAVYSGSRVTFLSLNGCGRVLIRYTYGKTSSDD